MKIEIRGECVHISGYVNAVGRDSRPIPSQTGKFVEMIEPGTFGKALERAENVDLLLNHNKGRKLGSTSVGNLALNEDSIGLRAEADIRDAEVVEKARSGKLRGWSFGMYVKNAELENRAEDIPRRHVREIDLFEVSLIDDTMNPCYIGTSVECRADAEQLIETRGTEDSAHEINEIAPPDYSEYEGRINGLRAMGELRAYEERLQELRYNPYHDPTNGRFTGPNGAGGGMLFVGKGQKGKGAYVFDSDNSYTPNQKATMDRMNKILSDRKDTHKMPEFKKDDDGNVDFYYETSQIVSKGHGKMNYVEDEYERITAHTGIIFANGKIHRGYNSGQKTISETLKKKGTLQKSKDTSAPKQSSLSVSAYAMNKGTSSQYFGIKTSEGDVIHAPNNWKTEKGALKWAEKNGYSVSRALPADDEHG